MSLNFKLGTLEPKSSLSKNRASKKLEKTNLPISLNFNDNGIEKTSIQHEIEFKSESEDNQKITINHSNKIKLMFFSPFF